MATTNKTNYIVCEKCGDLKQPTAFRAEGSKRLVDGNVKLYRSKYCRRCDRQLKIAVGLCICGQPLVEGKTSCQRCLEAVRKCVRDRNAIDRAEAIRRYGSSCAYCAESLTVFLTFDHINDDGAAHRKLKNGKNHSLNMGLWLRKNSYPKNIQLLCANCNHAKASIGSTALIALLRERGRLRPDFIGN